ncbi:MAG: SDR family NAD(P)-dependent oxidoreductase, partial [Acidobacteriota bacterium]
MKRQLRQIYEALSKGTLSQEEALERIKAIKQQEQRPERGVLLATPVWEPSGVEVRIGSSPTDFAAHHIVLCALPAIDPRAVEALVPLSRCEAWESGSDAAIAQRYIDCALACFARLQALMESRPQGKVLFQVLVGSDEESALFAGLSGLLKTATLENPQILGQLILVPGDLTAEGLGRLLREESAVGLDPLVRYEQGGVRRVPRWDELAPDLRVPPPTFKDGGVYLITGGLGGLGTLFAKEILAQAPQARIILTGRSPWTSERQMQADGLSDGRRVTYRQLDLCDLAGVEELVARIQREHHRLDGVLHCAGMTADNFLLKKPADEFRQVFAPKVQGTVNLDRATRDLELDLFVLFSSVVGAMGNVGQADYAAANGFLDQFAAYRNGLVAAGLRHGRTRSINWGIWEAGGMGIDPDIRERLQQITGIRPMQSAVGMAAFHRGLAWPCDQMLALEGELAHMRRTVVAGRPVELALPLLVAGNAPVTKEPEKSATDGQSLEEKTEEYLRRQCSELLKLPFHRIDPQAALEKYGIDSILAMKLTGQLEKTFGTLSKTLFFEYQTLRELSRYFVRAHSGRLNALFPAKNEANGEHPPARPVTESPAQDSTRRTANRTPATLPPHVPGATGDSGPIAIIGLSGRYPEAIDLEAYWRNLRDGKDSITEVPRERWDWREYFSEDRTASGHHYSKWGGFIAGVDEFDPLFFNISPKEAKTLDPQERLFLQHAWMAVEDAGYTRASLQGSQEDDLPGQVGVYAGVMFNEYQLLGAESSAQGKRLGMAGSAASIANRVSYALNLHGPSMTLDTMCSSSLTAIHLACQDLKLGRTSLAIAGGVNVTIHPNKYLLLSAGQFISSDGHCQSFGEGGDGYIPAEGVGVVVLKRLAEAERDGDHVYGIIRGSALTHGGKTNGFTVPNPGAQASAITRALLESKTEPRHISYLEAHGTGTRLGDPIEIAALNKAFQQSTQDTAFCLIGSAKSNIGHCESAAGIAGLTKVLLQMQHEQIVPSLHSAQLNPHIDFSGSPFVVNQSLQSWKRPVLGGRVVPRIAGISSFGAGGSNAHLIVEEAPPPVVETPSGANVVILLSARTPEQLVQRAVDLLGFIRTRAGAIDLVAMAYTLQVGREAMEERCAVVADSVMTLTEKLQTFVAGKTDLEDVHSGQVKRNREALSVFTTDSDLQQTLAQWLAGRKLSKLADLWAKGLDVDWSQLYTGAVPRRMSLPTYPFARERYWIDLDAAPQSHPAASPASVLHPLLHANTSDLAQQSYSSTFHGGEFFLTDGEREGRRTLSAAASLEMARAALQSATPASREGSLELLQVRWAEPIVVTGRQIGVAVLARESGELEYEIYSELEGEEIIHCQGRATLGGGAEAVPLELDRLRSQMVVDRSAVSGHESIQALHRGPGQILVDLTLPKSLVQTAGEYFLHPALLDAALQAAGWLDGGVLAAQTPAILESLTLRAPCSASMVAWIRRAPVAGAGPLDGLDIDLCDAQGRLAAQLRGLSWQPLSGEVSTEVGLVPAQEGAPEQDAPVVSVRREIEFAPLRPVSPEPTRRGKPAGISLSLPGAAGFNETIAPAARPLPLRGAVALAPAGHDGAFSKHANSSESTVRLYDDGDGLYSLEIGRSGPSHETVADLVRALQRAQDEPFLKVLRLRGVELCFPQGDRAELGQAIHHGVLKAITAFPAPIIAVLHHDTTGAGFLTAALCDVIVCNEDAHYGFTTPAGLAPTPAEARLLAGRLGAMQAHDLLYVDLAPTGRELRTKGWSASIVPAAEVETSAQKLALTFANKSLEALRLLKKHQNRHLAGFVEAMTESALDRPAALASGAGLAPAPMEDAASFRCEMPADRVLVVRLAVANGSTTARSLLHDLETLFTSLRRDAYFRAVVLFSDSAEFLPAQTMDATFVLDLQRLLDEMPIPVIAALAADSRGDAWLAGLVCDAVVYSESGVYSAAGVGQSAEAMQLAVATFTTRFGAAAGAEILLSAADDSGADLQRRLGCALVVAGSHVLPRAIALAEGWTRLPDSALASWKQSQAASIREKLRNFEDVPEVALDGDANERTLTAPARVALRSSVVTVTAHPQDIVVVAMEDRQAKNMFSDALMEGMVEAFAHIEETPAYKVVVITGYDTYFASGGTKESLLAIHAGTLRFTDSTILPLPLRCKLPVIAAMQGHGIGAGWSLGMLADLVLLSEDGRYVSPYMDYGFTPGAGATWSLPEKMGQDLARESLLTARPYTGRELKERGLKRSILPRAEVLPAALALAAQIAKAPRRRLIALKRQLTAHVHAQLEETQQLELAMHEKTFVGQAQILAKIEANFRQEAGPSPVVPPPVSETPQSGAMTMEPSVDEDALSLVTAVLRAQLATELQMREDDVDGSAQFIDLGLDSIGGVTWIRKINEKYQTTIDATKVYSYPTLEQFSRYVKAEAESRGTLSVPKVAHSAPPIPALVAHSPSAQRTVTGAAVRTVKGKLTSLRGGAAKRFATAAPAAPAARAVEPIAVIGMAGQFPQARNLDEFWRNIAEGKNCITQIPPRRWDLNAYYQPGESSPGKSNSPFVGALDEFDLFDPLFFNISPGEAEHMDPQQRLFLQACWHSIEDAGYAAQALSGSRCGVFVGCANGDYHQLSRQHQLSAQGFTGSAMSILAARISYFLNLQGPCVSVDTACSSSLVAMAQACDSLVLGDSDVALAGGVFVMAGPELHIKTSQAGMLSAEGRCFTFDQRADGFVPGEGVGVVMLKRLSDARRDGDIIQAVIEGWGVNQDGKTNGITAPNPESQTRLEQEVYDKYRIDPAAIQLIEAHGTGTKLGDPIEVEGLKKAFAKYTGNQGYCAIGSVKSNIGHCLTAAGIAGVIKLVLALRHRQLPPTINFERLNEHIDLTGSPFYVNDRLQPWVPGSAGQRRAAISSFGFSGTNAHIVIGEHSSPADGTKQPLAEVSPQGRCIVPLSARTAAQLDQKVRDLLALIRGQGSTVDLRALAYTLQVGREPMEVRLGFVVGSIGELAEKLESVLNDAGGLQDVHRGQVKGAKDSLSSLGLDEDMKETIVAKWVGGQKWSKVLDLWVKGLVLDWNRLYGDEKPQRISLPLYPFAKERYWIDVPAVGVDSRKEAVSVLHPLLHVNDSNLSELRYRSTFTGNEFFLTDHQVSAPGEARQKVLPGVAYLEMARAAIEQADPERGASAVLELHHTVWAQPIVVTEDKQVHVALSASDGDRIDYEIYSEDGDQEIVHAQGSAVWALREPAARLDLQQLATEMTELPMEPESVYATWAQMGLHYGPSFRGVVSIQRGSGQLLATIRLPECAQSTWGDYVLHPTLLDSALQACAGLLGDSSARSREPRLPFALETLRILGPCPREMVAWVRYSPGSGAGDPVVKMEIDLCDEQGNRCVQLLGLSSRPLTQGVVASAARGILYARPVWEAARPVMKQGADAPAEHHVILCEVTAVDPAALEAVLPRSRVLSLHAGGEESIARRYRAHAVASLEAIQTILRSKSSGRVLVQMVVPDLQEHALLAGLSGLLKTAALENPRFTGQLLLVPASTTAETLAGWLAAEENSTSDGSIRYEAGVRKVLRWQEVPSVPEIPRIPFRESGVYLITGGLGALGRLFAQEILKETGEAKVVLTGRSEWSADVQAVLDGLSAQRGRVSYRTLDLEDRDHVQRLITAIHDQFGGLHGVLHCAGMLADQLLWKKSGAEFDAVLAPKVSGTVHLDEATRSAALDFFVLFSSFAAAWGNVGQADYAAANGFLDQFAYYRNAQVAVGQRHGRTRSINWPLWQAGGMTLDPATVESLRETTGILPMASATGIRAFHHSLASPYDQFLVAEGNLGRLRRSLLGAPAPALEARPVSALSSAPVSTDRLTEQTSEYLSQQVSGLLKLPSHRIDAQAALERYGIDSILALKLTNQLERTFGPLSKTLFFEYQTIGELTQYFMREHSPRLAALFATTAEDGLRTEAVEHRPTPEVIPRSRKTRRPFQSSRGSATQETPETDSIAIIGLSGRYPQAIDLEQFWINLREGKDCVTEVPRERWDWREYFSEDRTQGGRHFSKWGGFIAGVDEFDPLFFNISPKEAKLIDPQERLFLQHAWMAVEDAGYSRAGLQAPQAGDLAGQVGVYVGLMYSEYQLFGAEASALGHRLGIAGSAGSIANRVSYALNLHGPSMTLDTMCSSSLTAIHLASQDLKSGRTSLAIAGGVNVSIHPNKYLVLSAGQFISGDGHCQSFGEGGDGYIPGEGVGVVVLKRLSEAKRDGDHIYGVIRGSALTHGGKTNGYTVPNPQAQTSAIGRALTESHIDARHVSYIEAHGTGTKLGDPIEIAALSHAFRQSTREAGFCLIGSAKSNIGHCESAAGIAGLTKVLLQMQHQQIVPSLHSTQLNPHIDFDTTPFVVNQTLKAWERPVIDGRSLPRIAGISSFGAGGSNAHMIVEEYQPPVRQPLPAAKTAILLSARTAEQLHQKASDLLRFVRQNAGSDLVSIAYTLQVGRDPMEERLGFIVSSVEQLAERLAAHVAGDAAIEDAYRGQAKRNQDSLSAFSTDPDLQQTVEKWLAGRKLAKLLDLWVKGLDVDWSRLYGAERPQRISLPAYPFARERCWIDVPARLGTVRSGAGSVIHPLVHANTSDPTDQRYGSTFTGEEAFLMDHQVGVGGPVRRMLPSLALLEMARTAIAQAFPAWRATAALELRDMAWGEPIFVDGPTHVSVALTADDRDEIGYEIYTRAGDREIVHLQGHAVPGAEAIPARVDLERLQRELSRAGDPDRVYAEFATRGLHYGPAFQAITAIRQDEDQVLAQLRLPAAVENGAGDYGLHPSMLEGAFQAAAGLLGGSLALQWPAAMDSLRIGSPSARQMVAWVRREPRTRALDNAKVEIDLCDEQGNVAVQMRGMSWQPLASVVPVSANAEAAASSHWAVRDEAVSPSSSRVRIEIALGPIEKTTAPPAASTKPSAPSARTRISLTLASPLIPIEHAPARERAPITLASPAPGDSPAASGAADPIVRLYDEGRGIFSVEIGTTTQVREGIAELQQALKRVQQESSIATVMLYGLERGLLDGGGEAYNVAVEQKLFESLITFPYPVIAIVPNDTRGAAFMAAALCDFMVCSETARYGYAEGLTDAGPAGTEAALLGLRFGSVCAQELLCGPAATGAQLRAKGWTCPIVPEAEVAVYALELASALATKPQKALRLLKRHLARDLEASVGTLTQRGNASESETPTQERAIPMATAPTRMERPEGGALLLALGANDGDRGLNPDLEIIPDAAGPLAEPIVIALRSAVVTVTAHPEGMVVVRMHDRQAKNQFSEAFVDGVAEAFAHIEQTPSYRVVVLTGYDHYFASGGTKESLLAIQAGQARFTDTRIFQLPLDCSIPVIAAMQGHGIGAGWTLGMFADLAILSEESHYVSPYMDYGFTPGAGATWVLADKMGRDLAGESLWTGRPFTGSELRQRGLKLPIMPRAEVEPAAMKLARRIARSSRESLIALKRTWTSDVHELLEETYRRELAMHEETFVGQSDTLAQIQSRFAAESGPIAARPQAEPAKGHSSPSDRNLVTSDRNLVTTDRNLVTTVTATLRTLLANELQMREDDIDERAQFVDLGLDSISGVTWIRKINEKYQTSIEATKVYSYPTLMELSRHVADEAGKLPNLHPAAEAHAREASSTGDAVATERIRVRASRSLASRRKHVQSNAKANRTESGEGHLQPVAIVGMAGQFPQAKNLDQFWRNLAEGRNCISEVSADRWDLATYYQPGKVVAGKTNSHWLGALEDYDRFDALFFNISPTEAECMDPQQRLFLEACWHSIESAGYDARGMSGSKCGVFVGCATGDYHQLSRAHQLSAQGFTGTATSIIAARISYFLNLQGPCVAVDTACSSSLVAISQACDSLNSGASDVALAGGVYVMAGPEMHIRTAQAAMVSPEGRCFTFDQRADGFVTGEGVGVVMLKRLADAERDQDIIYGVIQGWGINQDGKTNGITAPNPDSQTRLEQDVYDKYAIDPTAIQLIEAHGTGTKLGDPIEVEGLKNAFSKYTQNREYCALGSVKSNIGHCLTAAGIAGVLKVLLALKHRQLPPTINFERLNEHIDLTGSPFYVNTRLQAWEPAAASRRQAAISSFGFSGTNAHLVIGEHLPAAGVQRPAPVAQETKTVVPFSARTPEQLRQKAKDLLAFLRNERGSLRLSEIAYTLQVGRAAMDERLALVAGSIEQLVDRLQTYLDGGPRIEDVYEGQVKRNREAVAMFSRDADLQETVDRWMANRKLSKLAELWVQGLELDWNKLHDGETRPRRIGLPGYPFARDRHWIDAASIRRHAVPADSDPANDAATLATTVAGDASNGRLMATPDWQASALSRSDTAPSYAQHHVLLCGLSQATDSDLQALLPESHCLTVSVETGADVAQRYTAGALACFEQLQTIIRQRPSGEVLIQIVVADSPEHQLMVGLSGLLRTAALENAWLSGQLILTAAGIPAAALAGILQDERTRGLDALVRYDLGTRQVQRWTEVPESKDPSPIAFRDQGIYLITGGLGGLGLLFAREILERSIDARVILTGRAEPGPSTQSRLDRLSEYTTRVRYRQVDLNELGQVQSLIAQIAGEHAPLHGILHCAGMAADGFLSLKTAAEFAAVLAPKVTGTLHLDEATRDLPLDFFALFSSVASVLGNPGQADYAAANGFLDQFAADRNRQVAGGLRHGRTRSIHWGLWRDGGIRLDPANEELAFQTTGVQPMRTESALQAFHRALALPDDEILVVEGSRPKMIAYLQKARAFNPATAAVGAPSRALPSRRRAPISLTQLEQQIKAALAAVLRIEVSIIDVDQPFGEFGLDSFLGAELIVSLNKKYGTELSHIKLFDHATVRQFALFLEQELRNLAGPAEEAEEAGDRVTRSKPVTVASGETRIEVRRPAMDESQRAGERIAIIGMSGRYPKAGNLNQYWENLSEGRNSIEEVPPSRWDVNRYYDPDRNAKDKTNSKWLGALDDIDCFDPLFFRISPQEAAYMDPQHRLFLQESYRAFEDSGYSLTTLSNRKCGVYLGISTNEYLSLLTRNDVVSAPVTSNSYAIAAARIAYYLNLKGPAISIDTACSASLVAIHLASQALLNGEIDMALAGGVTLWLTPHSYVAMSQAGMFSPNGQCRTFDDAADGIVNGEGVGAVVLKRLSDAQRDGDFIYGVLLGSGINQDGKTNGITAPSVQSQIELERGVYERHGIHPESISYVETHGTGTRLGDPIELEALATVFREKTARKNYCALGSVKSNVGHTTSAAGVAGLQKVLLSMRHRTLVPTLNVTKENSRFDFESSPFYISRERKAWAVAPGSLRRAALSSFGFSGTNAHLVIEEYPQESWTPRGEGPEVVIPISARTPEQLRQRCCDLLAHLRTSEPPLDLEAIAYTLQMGREAMEERLGLVVSSVEQLAAKLDAYVSGEKNIDGVHEGHVEPGQDGMTIVGRDDDMQEAIDRWIERRKFSQLLDLWIRGLHFDWNKLYGEAKPRRIPLPTYPFARERYWVEETAHKEATGVFPSAADMKSIEDILNSVGDDTLDP